MKKKNLVIPVMLLSFALLSLPVMATPATRKENVTLTLETLLIADPDSAHWVDYNILHNEGISISNATLNREIQPDYTGPINNLYVTWNATTKFTSLIMPDPGARNIVKGEWVLTFTGEGATGTFEGVGHTKSIGLPPISLPGFYVDYHVVLQGTGDFKGQTLKLSYKGAPPPALEGTLIIPK